MVCSKPGYGDPILVARLTNTFERQRFRSIKATDFIAKNDLFLYKRMRRHRLSQKTSHQAYATTHMDASNLRLGVILIQWQNGEKRVIA